MRKRTTLACASLVVVLAVGSLFVATRRMSHSVWFDESQTHLISRQGTWGEMTALAMRERPYPPLFFFAVHYSLLWRNDETGLRLPSALFGAVTLVAVFLLGSELAGPVTGVIAAFLLFLTPGSFRYFVDGNPYTLLMLSSALSTFFLLRAARSDSWQDWSLYAVCAAVGLGTHSLFVFHLGAQILAGIWLRARAGGRTLWSQRRLVTIAFLLLGTVILWWSLYSRGGGLTRAVDPARLFEVSTLVSMAGMYAGPQSFGEWPQLLMWGPLQLLGLAALYRKSSDRFWAMALLAAAPLVAITALVKMTLFYVAYRYGLGVFPLACVVAACSIELRPGRLPVRAGAAVVLAAYCVAGAAFLAAAGPNTFGYQDWRGATAWLAGHRKAGEAVVVPDASLVPFTYYWTGPPPLSAVREEPDEMAALAASALEEQIVTSEAAKKTGDTPGWSRDLRRPQSNAGVSPGSFHSFSPRVWLVLGSLARENPLVARFTEFQGQSLGGRRKDLELALRRRGLEACQTAEFQRVIVLASGRAPCREAP